MYVFFSRNNDRMYESLYHIKYIFNFFLIIKKLLTYTKGDKTTHLSEVRAYSNSGTEVRVTRPSSLRVAIRPEDRA